MIATTSSAPSALPTTMQAITQASASTLIAIGARR